MRSVPTLLRLAGCCLAVMLVASPATAAEPKAVVERFHDVLSDVMKNAASLGIKGRYARLRPALERAFDLPRMIRIASGPAWGEADDAMREALVDAFGRMSAGTYASQFAGYSGEAFAIDEVKPGPRESRLVATRIIKSNGESVPITYVLVNGGENPGDWQIADILLNNTISELSVRRSEYRSIIEKQGLEGLVQTLNQKATELLDD